MKSTITPNSFDTSITALHEGIRFTQNELLRPLSYEGLVVESDSEVWWNTDMTEEEVRLRRLAEARTHAAEIVAASTSTYGPVLGPAVAATQHGEELEAGTELSIVDLKALELGGL